MGLCNAELLVQRADVMGRYATWRDALLFERVAPLAGAALGGIRGEATIDAIVMALQDAHPPFAGVQIEGG